MLKDLSHIRAKAIEMRGRGLSLGEICEKLSVKKTTAYYWIKGTKIPITDKQRKCAVAAGIVTKEKHRKLRQESYEKGAIEFVDLSKAPLFRDFVLIFLTEGYRKTRNYVFVTNSNPEIVKLALFWIRKLKNPERKCYYRIQIHKDNDEDEIKGFWAKELNVKPEEIEVSRKSNSGDMTKRNWRSVHGVMSVGTCDTYFRSKLESWMDLLQLEWKNFARA